MDECDRLAAVLSASLAGVPVFQGVPDRRPEEFVSFERTGGPMDDIVTDRAMFSVRCWSPTQKGARAVARAARDAIDGAADADPDVFGASVTSVYSDRDPDSGSPRVTVVCEIVFNI